MPYTFQAMTPEGQWVPGPPRAGLVPSPWCPARQLGELGTVACGPGMGGACATPAETATAKARVDRFRAALRTAGFDPGPATSQQYMLDKEAFTAALKWLNTKSQIQLVSSQTILRGNTRADRMRALATLLGPGLSLGTRMQPVHVAGLSLSADDADFVATALTDPMREAEVRAFVASLTGFICPQGTTTATGWRGGSYCAGPSGAVCPPGYTKQVSNPGTKSESINCVKTPLPTPPTPPIPPMPPDGLVPPRPAIPQSQADCPPGSTFKKGTFYDAPAGVSPSLSIPNSCTPPTTQTDCPTGYVFQLVEGQNKCVVVPQPPATGKGWLEQNWKWLLALIAVGGGAYYYAKQKRGLEVR